MIYIHIDIYINYIEVDFVEDNSVQSISRSHTHTHTPQTHRHYTHLHICTEIYTCGGIGKYAKKIYTLRIRLPIGHKRIYSMVRVVQRSFLAFHFVPVYIYAFCSIVSLPPTHSPLPQSPP